MPQLTPNETTPTSVDTPDGWYVKIGPPESPTHASLTLSDGDVVSRAHSWLSSKPFLKLGWFASSLYFSKVALHDASGTIVTFACCNTGGRWLSANEWTKFNLSAHGGISKSQTYFWLECFPTRRWLVQCYWKHPRFVCQYMLDEHNRWMGPAYQAAAMQCRSVCTQHYTLDVELFASRGNVENRYVKIEPYYVENNCTYSDNTINWIYIVFV